jgi:hypothetical protein
LLIVATGDNCGRQTKRPAALLIVARWDRHQLRTSDQPGRVDDHRHGGQLHRRRIRSIETGCPSFPIRGDSHRVPAALFIVATGDSCGRETSQAASPNVTSWQPLLLKPVAGRRRFGPISNRAPRSGRLASRGPQTDMIPDSPNSGDAGISAELQGVAENIASECLQRAMEFRTTL